MNAQTELNPLQDTRLAILNFIRIHETATIQELAQALELAVPTLRHHIAILERDGFVNRSKGRGKIGKPYLIFTLSRKGEESFPRRYKHLSSTLIGQLKKEEGRERVLDLMGAIAQRKVERNIEELGPTSRENQLDLMLTVMQGEGFEPQHKFMGNQIEIRHLNCPYQAVALEHPEVCEMDLRMLQICLGATIERQAWRPNGDRMCVFTATVDGKGPTP